MFRIEKTRIQRRTARSRHVASFLCAALSFIATAASASTRPQFRVEEATIADIQTALLEKRITAVELVNLYLARIKAYNGPGVEEPEGILGPIEPIAHARGINALGTLNLRPAARKAWGFDDRKARSMTDPIDADPAMPDALETAARLDAELARTGRLVGGAFRGGFHRLPREHERRACTHVASHRGNSRT
jgi:hypothetical protein